MVHVVDFYIVKFRSTFLVRTFSVCDFGVHFWCTFSSKYIFGEYVFGKVRFRWQPLDAPALASLLRYCQWNLLWEQLGF